MTADPQNPQVGDVFRNKQYRKHAITITAIGLQYALGVRGEGDEEGLRLSTIANYYEAIPKPPRTITVEWRLARVGESYLFGSGETKIVAVGDHHENRHWVITSDSESPEGTP